MLRDALVRHTPAPLLSVARRLVGRARRAASARRDIARWRAIAAAQPAPRTTPSVSYGHAHVPALDERSHGGMVKFQYLQQAFPNAPLDFNLVYMGSSSPPHDLRRVLELARARGAPVAWNQNGVGYPGWAGADWRRVNESMVAALGVAAHVFYQSAFCKLSADRWAREPAGAWEVLHNPVDTERFVPRSGERGDGLRLLLGGNQYQQYRYDAALRTLAALLRRGVDARLKVTGRLSWRPDWSRAEAEGRALAQQLGVTERVDLVGGYTQDEAPIVLADADLLLHPKYNDPCPGIVLEAMACGLPVVYSSSGGVPELVGADAGVGVPAPLDFEHDHPPDPDELADAVLVVAGAHETYAAAARSRAVERFDLRPWIERHRVVFQELLG